MYRLWNLDEIALCVTDHDERIVPDLSERKASGRLALPQQMVPTIDRDQITVGSFLTDTARTGELGGRFQPVDRRVGRKDVRSSLSTVRALLPKRTPGRKVSSQPHAGTDRDSRVAAYRCPHGDCSGQRARQPDRKPQVSARRKRASMPRRPRYRALRRVTGMSADGISWLGKSFVT